MPKTQSYDEMKQDHTKSQYNRDSAKPEEHKPAVARAGRREGNSNHVMKSPEELCQEFDHRTLTGDQRGEGDATLFEASIRVSVVEAGSAKRLH